MIINPYIFGGAGGSGYIIDDYAATVGYSLRDLISSTIDVVRVRRSSDSAESDFSATEVTDGTLTTWTGANDGFVVKLYNQGSGGATYDASQATAGNQPRIVSSGTLETAPNGKPALNSVSSDRLDVAGSYDIAAADNQWSITGVYSRASTGIQTKLLNGNLTSQYYISWNTSNNILSNGATYASSDTATGDFIHYYDYNASNQTYYRNGASIWSGTAPITAWTLTDLMQANSTYHSGYWQEAIIFDNDLSGSRTAVFSDINTHYSIY